MEARPDAEIVVEGSGGGGDGGDGDGGDGIGGDDGGRVPARRWRRGRFFTATHRPVVGQKGTAAAARARTATVALKMKIHVWMCSVLENATGSGERHRVEHTGKRMPNAERLDMRQ